MLLNIFDLENFINELKEAKVSKCYYATQIYAVSEAHAGARIVLTAKTKDYIIRYVYDINITALRFSEKEMKNLSEEAQKQLKALLKKLEENGISYSEGFWEP